MLRQFTTEDGYPYLADDGDRFGDATSAFPEFAEAAPASQPEPRRMFENATGIFPEFDAAAPRGGQSIVMKALKQALRYHPAMQPITMLQDLTTDPRTGERYQLWPERLIKSAATIGGDVASGEVYGGPRTLGLRREDYTDEPVPSAPTKDSTWLGRATGMAPVSQQGPAEELMERAQDLAGVLGGGPLTATRGSATLASGAKLPPEIGGPAMPSRRDLFRGLRKKVDELQQPDVQIKEPGRVADIQSAPAAQLPAVIPLGLPHAELTGQLAKTLNPDVDRRALMRGAGAAVANASRVGRVVEGLLPKGVPAAARAALPKFEEIWKRPIEAAWETIDPVLRKEIEDDFLVASDMPNKRAAMKEFGGKDGYENALQEHYFESDEVQGWTRDHARYEDYQLPGGENYRELLVKLPEQNIEGVSHEVLDAAARKQFGKGYFHLTPDEVKRLDAPRPEAPPQFHSNSWDEPNVLGHLRMHDREVPGVGKSLHLEELNSEWHQEGSKKGYGSTGVDTSKWTAVKESPFKVNSNYSGPPAWMVKDAQGESVRRVVASSAEEAIQKAVPTDALTIQHHGGVPDAPLKDTWPDFLLRRAIKEAVESGYDAVSWTPGEYQAQRYGFEPGDTKVPGGLHDFYDKHLVERANAIGKDYGTKVEHKDTPGFHDKHGTDQEIQYRIPVLHITPQLRKAVKDGSFALLSDAGKPGAAVAALEHAPPFHSAVEKAIQSSKMDKASPDQWLGYLRNRPGVRKDELEHLGLDKVPEAWKGKKSLSKEEVTAHAKEKAPQLEEMWKQAGYGDSNYPSLAIEHVNGRWRVVDEDGGVVSIHQTENAAHSAIDDLGSKGGGTKFADYQLPGGDNYRELLLRVPERPASQESIRNLMRNSGYTEEQARAVVGREHQDNYRTSHWDEPNVLAHARINDRDLPGVGKSLHLEELQSDWHQKGRKQGYRSGQNKPEYVLEGNGPWVIRTKDGRFVHDYNNKDLAKEALEYYKTGRLTDEALRNLVPDAPFKQTWPDLLLKRLIHEAAAKGYDSISWTPGEAQAARYDLSKQVAGIATQREPSGNYRLEVYPKHSHTPQIVEKSADKLADFIGKDMADKIVQHHEPSDTRYYGRKMWQDTDLKVGGEGMRAFYDKMLVDKANALGKKHGAKVEQQYIPVEGSRKDYDEAVRSGDSERIAAASGAKKQPIHVLRITPKLRDAVLREGFPLFSAPLPFGVAEDNK